jgi:hypothetical protein
VRVLSYNDKVAFLSSRGGGRDVFDELGGGVCWQAMERYPRVVRGEPGEVFGLVRGVSNTAIYILTSLTQGSTSGNGLGGVLGGSGV